MILDLWLILFFKFKKKTILKPGFKIIYFVVFLFFLTVFDSFGQEKDTLVQAENGKKTIQDIREFSEKKNIFSRIFKNFLVRHDSSTAPIFSPISPIGNYYDGYENKIIRNINIQVLDVFGPTLANPQRQQRGMLETASNVIHINTQNYIVRNRLLFKKGQVVDPLKMAESERLLRDMRSVFDAKIQIIDPSGSNENMGDSVDVDVVLQDIWSITSAFGADFGRQNGDISLKDVNFLGLGTELYGKVYYSNRNIRKWNYEGSYSFYNFLNTFFSGTFYYKDLPFLASYGGGVNKEFFSPVIKWAGGTNYRKDHFKSPLNFLDSNLIGTSVFKVQQDIWAGYATDFKKYSYINKQNNYIFALRFVNNLFPNPPNLDTLRFFLTNNNMMLASFGYSYRKFYKDKYLFQMGRTEDIPLGLTYAVTIGNMNIGKNQIPYLGIRSSHSKYFPKVGYLMGTLELGGFRNSGKWYNSIFSAEMIYFSKFISLRNDWYWRHLILNRLHYGFNVEPGYFVSIEQFNGLRGFLSGRDIIGTKKYVFNYESNFLTPLNMMGFRLSILLFIDLALVSPQNKSLMDSKLYQAYGIGFRIKNDHLIFNTIQINLAYYPQAVYAGRENIRFFEESRNFYPLNKFQFNRPAPISLDSPF